MATIPSHWPRAVFGPRATLCKLCPSFRSSPHLPTSCRHRVSVCRSTETVLGTHLGGLVFSPSLGHIQANGKVRNTDKERTLAQSWAFIPWGLDQRISWGSSSAAGLEPVICKAFHLRWGSTEASPLGGKQARLSPQPLALTSPMATGSALEVCPSVPALQEGPHCSGPSFSWLTQKGPRCQPMGVLLPTVSKATSSQDVQL